jgi:hypothetical protein
VDNDQQQHQQHQNPYAAPVFQEPPADALVWHRNYQLIGPKLLCKTGLFLPEYCLVTGAPSDLVPVPLALRAAPKSVRLYRHIGIGSLLCAPLSLTAAFLLIRSNVAPGDPLVVTLTLTTPLLLIAGLILFLIGGRQHTLCRLHGLLHRRRQVWQRRLALIPGGTMLIYVCPRFSGAMGQYWAIAAMLGVSVCTWLLVSLVFLRGLRLRAVLLDDGSFEIRGFSRAFLSRLETHPDGQ